MKLEHQEILNRGAVAWNEWRTENPDVHPDLAAASLRALDLCDYSFRYADLRGADLSGSKLDRADLLAADLRGANLSSADLSQAANLLPEQLAASNLARSKLPSDLDLASGLNVASEFSKIARATFILLLGFCVYSWLTIAGATDAGLLTNSVSSPLPIIGTEIPLLWFFIVAPSILFILYLHWQTQLLRMWSALARLPAIYSDGGEAHLRSSPWLLTHLGHGQRSPFVNDTVFSPLEELMARLMAWWLVPLSLLGFWFSCLVVRNWPLTLFLVLVWVLAVSFSRCSSQALELTQWQDKAQLFHWRRLLALRGPNALGRVTLAGTLALLLGSYLAIGRWPSQEPHRLYSQEPHRLYSDGEAKCELPGLHPLERANLRYESLSQPSQAGAKGAELRGVDLRLGRLFRAYLENADLRDAALQFSHLQEADLSGTDLGEANLLCADLRRARFDDANLSDRGTGGVLERKATNLREADLRGAELRRVDLRGADLSWAKLDCADETRNTLCTDLSGADASRATFTNTSLEGTILDDVNLTGAIGITQQQLDKACGNEGTQLDPGLKINYSCGETITTPALP